MHRANGKLLLFWLILLSAVTTLPLPAAAPAKDASGFSIRYIAGRKYYRMSDVARHFGMKLMKSGASWELSGAAGRMRFTPQKRFGSLNGIALTYDFAPVESGGMLFVSSTDFFDHLQPLLNNRALHCTRVRTILLDPGHGGNDQGAKGQRMVEKKLTLLVAEETQKALKKLGYTVFLTRVTDKALPLEARAAMVKTSGADLFLSIHMNAVNTRSVRGVETFALTAPGAPSSGSSQVSYARNKGDRALADSIVLAYCVQGALVRATGNSDRGVKRARYVVLRESSCPSILIECGFISNAADENNLVQSAYRTRLGNAIAQGVRSYHQRLRVRK